MSTWISTKDRLPEVGKYVIGYYNGKNWIYPEDPLNVNCKIVMLEKGISKEERKALIANGDERGQIECRCDQCGNNLEPYCWCEWGFQHYFGQDIILWAAIPALDQKDLSLIEHDNMPSEVTRGDTWGMADLMDKLVEKNKKQ